VGGAPAPESAQGQFLVAHELAHVAQSRAPGPAGDRGAVEADASRAAHAIVGGQPAGPLVAHSGGAFNLGEGEAHQQQQPGLLDRAAGMARDAAIGALLLSPAGPAAIGLLRTFQPSWIPEIIERLPEAALRGFLDAVLTVGLGPFGPYLVRSGIIEKVMRWASERFVHELMRIQREGVLPYLRHRLNELWPVGIGFRLEGNVGITFGYPIHVGAGEGVMLIKTSNDNFQIQRRGQLIVAGDTGVGAGVNIGAGRVGVHARGEVEAMAGTRVKLREIFDFPITTDQAFISFLCTLSGPAAQSVAGIAALLSTNLRALNPETYLTERELNYEQFASADAHGEAGLVSGQAPGRETWGRPGEGMSGRAGANPLGPARPGQPSQPWYITLWPEVSARLGIEIAAGVGVQMNPEPARDRVRPPGGEMPEPSYVDYEISAGASAMLSFSGVVPFLSQYIPQINANPGVELKVVFRVNHASTGQPLNPRFLRAVLALNNGDIDALSGSASETQIAAAVAHDPPAGQQQTLAGVLRDLAPDLQHRHRLVLAGAPSIPRWLRAWLDDKLGLGRTLQEVAFEIEGQLRFGLHIPASVTQAVLQHMSTALGQMTSGGVQATAQRLRTDLINWIQNGTVPSYMHSAGQALQALGQSRIEELAISGDMSLHLAADARAAFGAKLRIRADGRAGVRFQYNMLTDGAVTAEQAIRMVREYLRNHQVDGGSLLQLVGP
jgi:hypothetical protein